ncbi:hypothetical protein M5689_005647 [Euphorbia peplus]|nr:hypothetical protein M5689_005647 [Euphorbia peplus]
MGTEILRPQNCLVQRIGVSPCRRKNFNYNHYNYNTAPQQQQPSKFYDYSNPRPNRKPAPATAVRSETGPRKRHPDPPVRVSKRSSSADDLKSSRNHHGSNRGANANPNQNLVMEKLSILRRGESLDSKMKSMEMAVTGTDRMGPDPEFVSKQVRIGSPVTGNCDMYAGSGFAVSPAPSSLPLPSFSKKKQLTVDDSATRDLRRLLRLDF